MAKTDNEVFTIDGLNLRLRVIDLERSFAITDTENSGRTQAYRMHRDIIGTFYNYTLTIEPELSYMTDYYTFYQIITSPVSSHKVIFPYNDETLEFEAYITSGQDKYRKVKSVNIWKGLSVDFTAMEPQRRP